MATLPSHHPMANTYNIIQKSFFAFLRNRRYFVSTPTLLAFPYAASYLLAQSLVPSSRLFPFVHDRMSSLFLAARFPLSSPHFNFLCLKLSKTLLTHTLVSPFALSFLLLAKASVIAKALDHHQKPNLFFRSLLVTQICGTFIMLAGNAMCLFSFAFFFVFLDFLGLSSAQEPTVLLAGAGALVYYYIIQNSQIVCDLASVSSGIEGRGGFTSIALAWIVIRGKTTTALALDVATNVALSGVEALFHYRVVRGYLALSSSGLVIVAEGALIAFLYAVILVFDMIVGCVFWMVFKKDERIEDRREEFVSVV